MIRPLISEKSMKLAGSGWYTFAVPLRERKEHIAREVSELYHVDVVSVRTLSVHGKVRRTGKSMRSARRPDWKKAIAQVKKGQHIDAFEAPVEPAKPTEKKTNEKKTTEKKTTEEIKPEEKK